MSRAFIAGQVAHQGRTFQADVIIVDNEIVVYLPMEVLNNCTNLTHMVTFKDQETTLLNPLPRKLYAAYGISAEKIAWLESVNAKPFDNPMICTIPIDIRGEIHFDTYSGHYLATTSLEELKRKYAQRIQTA